MAQLPYECIFLLNIICKSSAPKCKHFPGQMCQISVNFGVLLTVRSSFFLVNQIGVCLFEAKNILCFPSCSPHKLRETVGHFITMMKDFLSSKSNSFSGSA